MGEDPWAQTRTNDDNDDEVVTELVVGKGVEVKVPPLPPSAPSRLRRGTRGGWWLLLVLALQPP